MNLLGIRCGDLDVCALNYDMNLPRTSGYKELNKNKSLGTVLFCILLDDLVEVLGIEKLR